MCWINMTCIETKNMLSIVYNFRQTVRWDELCNQLDALTSLSLLNVTLKTKGAISTFVHTNRSSSCANSGLNNRYSFKSFTLGARCETASELASHNVFCSAHVDIRRTCFAAISCHCPSSLNITLEFHLKGEIHCKCGNFLCLMNKTEERDS